MNDHDQCPRCGYPDDEARDESDAPTSRPPAQWTDDELRAGLVQLAERIVELKTGITGLTAVAAQLADERDRRAGVYRQAEIAMAEAVGVKVVGEGRLLQPPGLRRAERRRNTGDPRVS
jgi:hypothetical protein